MEGSGEVSVVGLLPVIIYTRFNPIQACMRSPTHSKREPRRLDAARFDEEWLKRRMVLFSHYTYPSVMSQTDQDFKWIGIVHRDSPEWFIAGFDKYPRISIELVETDVEVGNPNEVTVNLDSDDAIARQFVELAKQYSRDVPMCFVKGQKVRISSGIYIASNAHRSSVNIIPAGDQTVLDRSHGAWPYIEPIRDLDPMWLQVIHHDNFANRLRRPKHTRGLDYEKCVKPHFEIRPLPTTEIL